jgi:hypothetical protein
MQMPEPTIADFVQAVEVQLTAAQRDAAHLTMTIKGLEARQAQLEEQISVLQATRTLALTLRKGLASGELASALAAEIGQGVPDAATAPVAREPATIADHAEVVLQQFGGEAEMSTLVRVLKEREVLRGREPRATLSTQLIRHPERFHRHPDGKWALGPGPQPRSAAQPPSNGSESTNGVEPPVGYSEDELDDLLDRELTPEDDSPDEESGYERVGPISMGEPLDDDPF